MFLLRICFEIYLEKIANVADKEKIPERLRTAISFRYLIILATNA